MLIRSTFPPTPDTSSIKDWVRLLLLKYSNLGEYKSPPRRFVGVIYFKLGNENDSDFHKRGDQITSLGFEKMKVWRSSLRFHFERGMLPWGRSWSRIWQIWGKSLIDDTDMGSSGERRNHQFSLPINITLGSQNAKITRYAEFFPRKFLSPLSTWRKQGLLLIVVFCENRD